MKLTSDERKLIKTALQYVYDTKLAGIRQQVAIISEEEKTAALVAANKYWDLMEKI